MASDFEIHPRLAADTIFLTDWPLSQVRLMNDARYMWIVLIPRIDSVVEIYDLEIPDRNVLIDEIARASAAIKSATAAEKINIGALGNIVPQLHVHVIARNAGDPAWPGPVWGHSAPQIYTDEGIEARIAALRTHL